MFGNIIYKNLYFIENKIAERDRKDYTVYRKLDSSGEKRKMEKQKSKMGIRILMTIVGIALTAISVGLQKISGLGVDPFSVLVFGFVNAFDAPYQTVYIVVCVVLIALAMIFNRKLLGIATIVSLFCSGFVTDATVEIVAKVLGTEPALWIRVALLLFVVLLISISSALYYSAALGVSPYDAQALTISEKFKLPFRGTRIATDAACCLIGFLLGGDLGFATILYACCMGPFIQWCREHITDKMVGMW